MMESERTKMEGQDGGFGLIWRVNLESVAEKKQRSECSGNRKERKERLASLFLSFFLFFTLKRWKKEN